MEADLESIEETPADEGRGGEEESVPMLNGGETAPGDGIFACADETAVDEAATGVAT